MRNFERETSCKPLLSIKFSTPRPTPKPLLVRMVVAAWAFRPKGIPDLLVRVGSIFLLIIFFGVSLFLPSETFAAKGKKAESKKTESSQETKQTPVQTQEPAVRPSGGNVTTSVIPASTKTEKQPAASYVPDENDVKSFVYHWFAWLDHQVEDFLFLYHVSKDDLVMEVPQAKITSHADFVKWYQGLRSETKSIKYEVGDIKVKELPGNKFNVEISVRCKSKTVKGETLDAKYAQHWELSVSPSGRLTINRYIVKKMK
jgi:hypothetical protein